MITLVIPFPGFYYSTLSDEMDHAEEMLIGTLTGKGDYGGEDPEFPDFDELDMATAFIDAVNYRAFRLSVAKAYAERFAQELPFALAFEFLDSPREYNFTTDRCFMTLPLSDFERMRAEVDPDAWVATLKEMFSSRSWFCSHYSDNPSHWTKPVSEYDHNEAGAVLKAYMATHCPDLDGLDWDWYIVEKMRDNGIFCSALDDALDMDKLRLVLSGDQ